MKKFWTASVLALGSLLASHQEAPAWINFKVGLGFTWQWQSGGNSLFWGMWDNGQPPGPNFFHQGPPMAFQPMFAGGAYHHAPAPHMDYFRPMPHHQQPNWTPPPPQQWTPPPPQPGNGQSGYQAPVYPASYYSGHNYYVPAYWYGR